MLDMIRARFKAITPVIGKYPSIMEHFYSKTNQIFLPLDSVNM
jgi:hypothetical protein